MKYHKNFRGYNYEETKDKVWTDEDDRKLMYFHKKGTPEIALAGIFKVNIKVIKERLIKLLK